MKFVLDTNVLVSSLSSRSPFHWVIEGLRANRYKMIVSTPILLEYDEILTQKYGKSTAQIFLDALMLRQNLQLVDPRFQWHFLSDPEDDKFVDAAIAGSADFIVSEDRDFRVLKNIDHPTIIAISIVEFQRLIVSI